MSSHGYLHCSIKIIKTGPTRAKIIARVYIILYILRGRKHGRCRGRSPMSCRRGARDTDGRRDQGLAEPQSCTKKREPD